MKPTGRLIHYRSRVDGQIYPYAFCETGFDGKPMPVIIHVNPGGPELAHAVMLTEQLCERAKRFGERCIAIRPTGRGPGTVYQNYGEVDLLEALDHLKANYPIDEARIYLTGASMGGAACWYLASHYPDLFAGAAIWCGYCDYRLWEKPGGSTFHMRPWEEPSWQMRSAAFLLENLATTPILALHGEWDRGVGGGVPVEHSTNMIRAMKARGYTCEYIEIPQAGHDSDFPKLHDRAVRWLLRQRKNLTPKKVELVTYGLRHNRNAWVTIEQMIESGKRASVTASIEGARVVIETENVRALTLGGVPTRALLKAVSFRGPRANPGAPGPVNLPSSEGRRVTGAFTSDALRRGPRSSRRGTLSFIRSGDGSWRRAVSLPRNAKHHAASGPISDLFFDGTLLVHGTGGGKAEQFFNRWLPQQAAYFFASRNGGVHRGGIPGQTDVMLRQVADRELTDEQRTSNNLLLYGNPRNNSIFKRYASRLPIRVGKNELTLAGKTFRGDRVACIAVFPHPENAQRYVAVHTGVAPDATTWGSHLDMMLLPDYLVYNRGELLAWGFFDNEWRAR